MAVTLKGNNGTYEGTSEDNKPLDVPVNTEFNELDTGKTYYFDGETWNEEPPCEGGGFTPTAEQLAAMNSGITAEDVEQIETNKNNISSIDTALGKYLTAPYQMQTYEYGGIDGYGKLTTANNRIRTSAFLNINGLKSVSANDNQLFLVAWTADQSYGTESSNTPGG